MADLGRSVRALCCAIAATAVAALILSAGAGAAELPEKDPFYQPPAGFEADAPGTVLRSRQVTIPEISSSDKAYQLLFRSTGTYDEPIAAVTTIMVPDTPWAGKGERPFEAFQPPYDALGDQCDPSYELPEGEEAYLAASGPAVERGWEVEEPDFEGEGMAWMDGPLAAHVILDSIRAAYNFAPDDIGPSNPLGLAGYSGGGEATAWALEQQASYAPELHVVAGAPGGIPINLKEVYEKLNGGEFFGIAWGAAVGINRGYPELELQSLLNAEGEAAYKKVEKQCISEFESEYSGKTISDFTKPEYPEPLNLPKVAGVLAADSLGTEPSAPNDTLPSSPVFLWESETDELIPVGGVDDLANYYCSEGLDVTYDRGQGEHVEFALQNAAAAVAYLEARFNGEEVASTCGVNASENTAIDSGPSGKTEEDSATFTYSAEPDVAGTTFECRLDGAEFESCPTSGVTYSDLAAGEHSFQVRSLTASGDKDLSPATRTFAVTGADVGVSVSAAPNPATVKKRLTYTVTVENAGPEAATGVVLTNVLAGSLKIRSGQSSQGTCTVPKGKHAGDTVTCSLGALQAGAKATVTLVVRPTAVGTVSDSSSVTDSGPPDRNPSNNSATQSTTVNPRK